MRDNINHTTEPHGTLAAVRALIPDRPLSFLEALHIAELQADRLLQLSGCRDQPAGADLITRLPRIRIEYRNLPTSGISYWNGREWIIGINRDEPETRQRFTLLHEFKHIIDHGHTQQLYRGDSQRAEQAADYFAGCTLMPKRLMKSAWGNGIQAVEDLAQTFDVSEPAIRVRLAQLRLAEPNQRCPSPAVADPAPRSKARYYRQTSPSFTTVSNLQEAAA